jgi:transposase-like protein
MSTPACPKCNQTRFVVTEPVMLLSMPPKQQYSCTQCHFGWYVTAESYDAREAEDESES